MLEIWAERTAFDIDFNGAVGVLCVGSCEQHSRHLPLGTDAMLASCVAVDAARIASSRVLLLPVQTVGFSPHHRAFKGYITLSQDVMFHYYMEVCRCVFANGLKKLILLNAHGGNQSCLQTVVNELGAADGYRPVLVRYWDLIAAEVSSIRESRPGGMGHAGEFETSLMMHYHPDLVHIDRATAVEPATGNEYHAPDLFARNTVYQYKPFDEYSPDGNVGQPLYATAEKGALLAQAAARALARLIDRFALEAF